jgi:hypothetical protein
MSNRKNKQIPVTALLVSKYLAYLNSQVERAMLCFYLTIVTNIRYFKNNYILKFILYTNLGLLT